MKKPNQEDVELTELTNGDVTKILQRIEILFMVADFKQLLAAYVALRVRAKVFENDLDEASMNSVKATADEFIEYYETQFKKHKKEKEQ